MSVDNEIAQVLLAKAEAIVARAGDKLEMLIHPDFVYVNAAGRTFDKAGYIDAYCTSGKIVIAEQRISNLTVQEFLAWPRRPSLPTIASWSTARPSRRPTNRCASSLPARRVGSGSPARPGPPLRSEQAGARRHRIAGRPLAGLG